MKSALVAVFLFSFVISARAANPSPEVLAITNVNVVDTRDGGLAPNATVLVKNGTITAIAKVALLDAGPHVRIINAGGKYLIPGLWDMNAHVSGPALDLWNRKSLFTLYLANGVTGLRDLNFKKEAGFADSLRPEISGDPESGQNERHSLEDLKEAMLACSSRGEELRLKGNDSLDDEETIAREIRHSYDPNRAQEYFANLSKHSTWVVPSLVSVDASAPPTREVPESPFRYLPSQLVIPADQDDEPELVMERKEEATRDMVLVHDMGRAGVQFLAGTNSPGVNLVPGFSLHRELELLVKSGFSPFAALKTATFNPALYMSKADKFGVVEPGHIANLVLLEDNPLIDIRNTQKIAAVILHGVYYSREYLGHILSAKEPLTSHQASAGKEIDKERAQQASQCPAPIRGVKCPIRCSE